MPAYEAGLVETANDDRAGADVRPGFLQGPGAGGRRGIPQRRVPGPPRP